MEEKTQDKYNESVEPVGDVESEPQKEVSQPVESEPVKEPLPSTPAPGPVVASDDDQQPVEPADDSANQEEVKRLSQIAFEKGLDEAIEEAKKIDKPYILDEFHDSLVNELYQQLVEAGKLEQK